MRIDPNVVVFPVQSSTTGEPKKPTTRATTASEGKATVVKLSAGATAAADESELSSVHNAKLDRIRGLIERGEYPIDLDMLSSRIVDDDLLRGRA